MSTATHAPAHADSAASDIDGTQSGPDADNGKLFELPRVKILADDTDPNVIRLTFNGKVDLERGDANDADLYNRLKAGQTVTLEIEAHVGTTKTTHRRDGEGDVDSVVQSKSLVVHSITSR